METINISNNSHPLKESHEFGVVFGENKYSVYSLKEEDQEGVYFRVLAYELFDNLDVEDGVEEMIGIDKFNTVFDAAEYSADALIAHIKQVLL